MIYGSDRWFACQYRIARECAAAAGWRCAGCGRKIRADREPREQWTSLLPSMQPAHVACIPSPSLHDLRETWGEPAADSWLSSPFLPDLRAIPEPAELRDGP